MKTKVFIIIGIIILTISSCRKYPEGGSYFFLNNMVASISGGYSFSHYYVNGIDSVDYYLKQNSKNNYFETHIEFLSSVGTPQGYYMPYHRKIDSTVYWFNFSGNWSLSKDKKKITFGNNITIGTPKNFDTIIYIPPLSARNEWDIVRFKDEELILETNYKGVNYRLELN